MFEHDVFIKYDFKEVVLGTDTHLMDVRWMREFEAEWIKTARGEEADPYVVGYVTDISAIEIADNGIEIAFFANKRTCRPYKIVQKSYGRDQLGRAADVAIAKGVDLIALP